MAYKQLKLWFDKDLAIILSEKITKEYLDFDSKQFIKNIENGVDELELKDRVELIADNLKTFLPEEYPSTIAILNNILGPENKEETGMFKIGYWIMPIAKFVEKYGLEHFDVSMNAIREITKRNTSEYAIRPFIEKYPERTMTILEKWSKDANFHVRRLASEGPRPRLPWASKLPQFIENPLPLLPILENLKDDKVKYIQKSVANCINDILKDNYEIGMELLERWSKDATKERKWIIKHALRNFLKKEDKRAIGLVTDD